MLFRMAVRGLLRDRRFAVVAILTLALGLGASVAIFAVADGMLLRPLPFPHSDRLVALYRVRAAEGRRMVLSRPLLREVSLQCDAFEAVAARRPSSAGRPARACPSSTSARMLGD